MSNENRSRQCARKPSGARSKRPRLGLSGRKSRRLKSFPYVSVSLNKGDAPPYRTLSFFKNTNSRWSYTPPVHIGGRKLWLSAALALLLYLSSPLTWLASAAPCAMSLSAPCCRPQGAIFIAPCCQIQPASAPFSVALIAPARASVADPHQYDLPAILVSPAPPRFLKLAPVFSPKSRCRRPEQPRRAPVLVALRPRNAEISSLSQSQRHKKEENTHDYRTHSVRLRRRLRRKLRRWHLHLLVLQRQIEPTKQQRSAPEMVRSVVVWRYDFCAARAHLSNPSPKRAGGHAAIISLDAAPIRARRAPEISCAR